MRSRNGPIEHPKRLRRAGEVIVTEQWCCASKEETACEKVGMDRPTRAVCCFETLRVLSSGSIAWRSGFQTLLCDVDLLI